MNRQTIIRSIPEGSSLNPEPSRLLQSKEKLNLQVNCVLSVNLSVNNSNSQYITNKSGTLSHVNNNSNNHLEIEQLKEEIKALKELLSTKEEIIYLLKKQNDKN